MFMGHVSAELKKSSPDAKFLLPAIAAEAKAQKLAGKYDEAHWKAEAAKKAASAPVVVATQASDSEAVASSSSKKYRKTAPVVEATVVGESAPKKVARKVKASA